MEQAQEMQSVSVKGQPQEWAKLIRKLRWIGMEDEARRLKNEYVSIEHILLAMTDDGGVTGRLFKEFGLTRDRLMKALQEAVSEGELADIFRELPPEYEELRTGSLTGGSGRLTRPPAS